MSLSYINDNALKRIVKSIIVKAIEKSKNAERNLYSNIVDPFSAVFDSLIKDISLSQWLYLEAGRQCQKSLQNSIGEFHEQVIGEVDGWVNLPVGNVVDVVNGEKKIIAEIKNKHNTTKGNHKKEIYDDIANLLSGDYKGFTGFYVEVLPKNRRPYNNQFVPSDNVTHKRRPERADIRIIDGKSFYEIVTGESSAIIDLYNYLPNIIIQILVEMGKNKSAANSTSEKEYRELINRVFEL